METSYFKKLMFIAIAFSMFNYGSRASAMEENVNVYEDESLNGYVLNVSCHVSIDRTDIEEIVKLLSNTQQPVVSCSIHGMGLLATDLTALLKVLEHNTSLTSLSLSVFSLSIYGFGTDAAVISLAQMLEHNTSLTSLNLSFSDIGDAGAKALAKVLEHNTSLTSLDLSFNDIGAAGAEALATMLKHNTSLTSLELSIKNAKIDKALARNCLLRDLLLVISHAMLYERLTSYVAISSTTDLLSVIMNGTIDQYVDATTLQKHQATIQKIKELHLAVISRAATTTTNASASASSSSVNTGASSGSTSSITSESASTTLMQEAQQLFSATVPLVAALFGSTAMMYIFHTHHQS